MISCSIKGVRITFDFGFFMVLAFFSLSDPYGLALSVMCACIIHEAGHIITALVCGVDIREVHFRTEGIRMLTDRRINALSKDIPIFLSGPLFNIFAAILYYIKGSFDPFAVNMVMGCYNLLPFSKLDGGALLSEILEWFGIFSPIVMRVTAVLSASAIILSFILTDTGSVILYVMLIFLAVSEFCY